MKIQAGAFGFTAIIKHSFGTNGDVLHMVWCIWAVEARKAEEINMWSTPFSPTCWAQFHFHTGPPQLHLVIIEGSKSQLNPF